MADFSCSIHQADGISVVTVTGEVDLATYQQLWTAVCEQLSPLATVILDCSGITFLDSMGLKVLVRSHHHARREQAVFVLAGVPERVVRVLTAAGLGHAFSAFDDVASARDAAVGRIA